MLKTSRMMSLKQTSKKLHAKVNTINNVFIRDKILVAMPTVACEN
ncbi:hypothetical protein [Plectonema radiosum]|nr:hypothetical protein [Plectonema radiosum]